MGHVTCAIKIFRLEVRQVLVVKNFNTYSILYNFQYIIYDIFLEVINSC